MANNVHGNAGISFYTEYLDTAKMFLKELIQCTEFLCIGYHRRVIWIGNTGYRVKKICGVYGYQCVGCHLVATGNFCPYIVVVELAPLLNGKRVLRFAEIKQALGFAA